jgi:hypothetical protein
LLAPMSLMVVGIDGRDNKRKSNRTTSNHSVEQVKPPSDHTTGYPSRDFERYMPLKTERPQNPVGLTLDSCESRFNEISRVGLEASGPEPDTVAQFLEGLEQKVGRLVT